MLVNYSHRSLGMDFLIRDQVNGQGRPTKKYEYRFMAKKIFHRQYGQTAHAMSRLLILAAVVTLAACNGESDRSGRSEFTSTLTPFAHTEDIVTNLVSYALSTVLSPTPRTTTLLPRNSLDMINSSTVAPAAPATTERTTALQPATLTILHIEDNPDDLRAMRQMFASLHTLTLRATRTGEFGIKLATANPPALILLDMALPGINGEEVLRRLREHPATRDIPVVAITSRTQALGMELGLTGFDDYLAKPVDTASLESVLNRRLGNNQKPPSEPATLVQQ